MKGFKKKNQPPFFLFFPLDVFLEKKCPNLFPPVLIWVFLGKKQKKKRPFLNPHSQKKFKPTEKILSLLYPLWIFFFFFFQTPSPFFFGAKAPRLFFPPLKNNGFFSPFANLLNKSLFPLFKGFGPGVPPGQSPFFFKI